MPQTRSLPALAAFLIAGAAGAAPIELHHAPLSCVPPNRYALVTASAVPATVVAGADLEFRSDPNGGWHAIAMTNESGTWSARLPRPTTSLEWFEYRVVLTSTTTEQFRVRVAAAEPCEPAAARPSIASPIVVKVPEGAPLVPPVPGGFSPTGVVAWTPPARPRFTARSAALGAGVALGGAALVARVAGGGSKQPARTLDIPAFTFVRTSPPPNSVLSLSRSTLVVFVVMDHEPAQPLRLEWRLVLLQDGAGAPCVVMADAFNGAQRPRSLALTAPLAATGACGERFEVTDARLVIQVRGPVYDAILPLPFRIEP
jgi:hypothetical protein